MTGPRLKPWVYGPFELIRHAQEHLDLGTDFDKRMALIAFDNAIEVSITTYLQLRPSQRGGRQFRRKDVDQWLTNYHTKLRFLDHIMSELAAPSLVTTDELAWYHRLRNELYHGVNGMVPSERSLAGARSASFAVFSLLFAVDPEPLLHQSVPSPRAAPQLGTRPTSAEVELMRSLSELERTLRATLLSMGALGSDDSYITLGRSWDLFIEHSGVVPAGMAGVAHEAIAACSAAEHGGACSLSRQECISLSEAVRTMTRYVADYAVSVDILLALKNRYPRWLRPDVASVRFVQRRGKVYLEVGYQRPVGLLADEEVTRTDLDFIRGGPEDDEAFFSPDRTAKQNAQRFVDEFDAFSIMNCTDLFRSEVYHEIAEEHRRGRSDSN